MRRAATFLLAALLLSGCGGSDEEESLPQAEPKATEPATLTVTGTVEAPIDPRTAVKADSPTIGVTPCVTTDGYDDIAQGAQVTVRGASGETVALGTLEEGTLGGSSGDLLITAPCAFAFTIPDVPAGQKFYSVEVASRGDVNFSEADLADPVSLTVGD